MSVLPFPLRNADLGTKVKGIGGSVLLSSYNSIRNGVILGYKSHTKHISKVTHYLGNSE